MKVVIDSAIPYIKGVLEPYAEVIYRAGNAFSAEEVSDADALIIRTRTRCSRELLESSRVKLIATATIGFDHIDLDYCHQKGIKVITAAGCNAAGVLQWVAAALAMLLKADNRKPHELTLGVVGVGNVGSLVEQYAREWGFKTICCDPPRKIREGGDFVPLEDVVRSADIITFHTPLNLSTYHLINEHIISMMRPNAVIINSSRGEVADSQALLKATQRLMIDVWEHEPQINKELLSKAMVATPHIAGYSAQGKANASAAVVRAVAEHFALPLTTWYPEQVKRVERQPIDWPKMCHTIDSYCDLAAESIRLKSRSEEFESIRNNYNYREEYF